MGAVRAVMWLHAQERERRTRARRCDVVVIGGGSAGVAAAVGAARLGARVVLVERYGFLGGAATHSLVLAYCGLFAATPAGVPEPLVAGVAADVLRQMAALGVDVAPSQTVSTGNWVLRLNPEALKIGLDRVAQQAGVELVCHSELIGVQVAQGRIASLRVIDPAGAYDIHAAAFIDASGDCALAHLAGLPPSPHFPPGHSTAPGSFPIRIGGLPGGLVLDRAAIAEAVADLPDLPGRASLRRRGSFITPLPGTDDLWWLVIDLRTSGLAGDDMAEAERDGRALAWAAVARLRARVAGFERANLAATGPRLGLRETRHVASVEDVVEQDATTGRRRADGIARAGWPMEIHHAPGHTEYRRIGGAGFFDVPLGAVRARGMDNLFLAGRTVGADAAAFASVRVMGTAFATGHAAGIAAALQAQQALEPDAVRRALLAQGAIL